MKQNSLNVLIACEESQAECAAFRALGHKAFSCDIQPCRKSGNKAWHIQSDVTPYLQGKTDFVTLDGKRHHISHWNLIVCHPPCTYLCRVSAVKMHTNEDMFVCRDGHIIGVNGKRYRAMVEARDFFFKCLNAKADYVAVENPIPMALADLPKPSFFACPSWYGVKYTKKTLYWVKNLPPLMPKIINPNTKCFVTFSRGKYRSRTFPQLAQAIAEQWSEYIILDKCRNLIASAIKPPAP